MLGDRLVLIALLQSGGASAVELGKARAARAGAPKIGIPMTYAESEVTPLLGEMNDSLKTARLAKQSSSLNNKH